MAKIFIDTSVFIRYLTQDNSEKFKNCSQLLENIEAGKLRPYTSNIVIFEILFVLTRLYKFPKEEILDTIQKILMIRNLTLIETTNSKLALKLFEKHNIKYPDCLIASQVPKGAKLATYDADFSKIEDISPVTPSVLL